MEKLFFNFADFIYGHSWISVFVLALIVWFSVAKMKDDIDVGFLAAYAFSILAFFFEAGSLATALILTSIYLVGYMITVAAVLFFAFSVPIGSVLLWDRISTARHRRREEAEKARLAKAVVVSFPHNHLKALGMEKLKKYVLPVATIFFFLNLTGCKSDFEALVVSVYTLVFAVVLVILVLALAALWGLWKVVCWLRHIRK